VFFDGVQAGRVQVAWVDETTARPTGRLLTAIIWLFAWWRLSLPPAAQRGFQGHRVFVGLMLSIGASGIVNQAVSGLMLMVHEGPASRRFVQIGDTEGTVTSVGFLTTRIETLRHGRSEYPNGFIAGNVTPTILGCADGGIGGGPRFDRLRRTLRQVEAMLQIAAGAHRGRGEGSAAAGAADRRYRTSTWSTP